MPVFLAGAEGRLCPLADTRKNLRACAFPRFFRPLRQHKLLAYALFKERRSALLRLPGKIFGLALFLDFSDRCANTSSLHLPPAAGACVARHARASVQVFTLTKNTGTAKRCLYFWQGQKDLNPRHAVLETAALPTELYP